MCGVEHWRGFVVRYGTRLDSPNWQSVHSFDTALLAYVILDVVSLHYDFYGGADDTIPSIVQTWSVAMRLVSWGCAW